MNRVKTIQELAVLLNEKPYIDIVGGGTLVVPAWQTKKTPKEAVYLPTIAELHHVGENYCGAAVTVTDIAYNPAFPTALREAAISIGGPAIRNIATLGGNLGALNPGCLAVALLAIEATVDCLENTPSMTLTRRNLVEIINGPRRPIISVRWEMTTTKRTVFRKVGVRAAGGPNLGAIAICWDGPIAPEKCAIAVGSTGSTPHRLPRAEAQWSKMVANPFAAADGAGRTAAEETTIVDSGTGDVEYRRHLIEVLVRSTLLMLINAV